MNPQSQSNISSNGSILYKDITFIVYTNKKMNQYSKYRVVEHIHGRNLPFSDFLVTIRVPIPEYLGRMSITTADKDLARLGHQAIHSHGIDYVRIVAPVLHKKTF